VTTHKLGMPADLKRQLEYALPRQHGKYPPAVRVTPRDHRERRCAAYDADHYEVQAYYTTTSADSLSVLEEALKAVPGVYATTQVRAGDPGVSRKNTFTSPDWPLPLGTARLGRDDLRPQVIALIRDDP
jgi:hypothetical protein